VITFTRDGGDLPGFFSEVDYVPQEHEVTTIINNNEEIDPMFDISRPEKLEYEDRPIILSEYDDYDSLDYDQPSFFIARYPIQYFLFCLGFTLLMALLFCKF